MRTNSSGDESAGPKTRGLCPARRRAGKGKSKKTTHTMTSQIIMRSTGSRRPGTQNSRALSKNTARY